MQEKKQSRALWPVMGLILGLALLALAAVLVEPIMTALPDNVERQLRNLPLLIRPDLLNLGISINQGQAAVGAAIFVVFLSIVAIVVAVAAPKRKIHVRESEMLKARNASVAEEKARTKLAQQIARENRQQVREAAKRNTRE
jgi:hypothetical protein